MYFGETRIVELDGVNVSAVAELRKLSHVLHVERLRSARSTNDVQWTHQVLATVTALLKELISDHHQHQLRGWHFDQVPKLPSGPRPNEGRTVLTRPPGI